MGSFLEYRRPDLRTLAPAMFSPTVTHRELILDAIAAAVAACAVGKWRLAVVHTVALGRGESLVG